MEPDITAPKILQRLRGSLSAYFDFDSGPNCSKLFNWMSTYMTALGQRLDGEVIKNGANRLDGKDFEDWKSIYINDAIRLQAHAIGTFAHHVADVATLQISADRKVPCESGYRYIDDFSDCWKSARQHLLQERSVIPSSPRYQRKRAGRSWLPYPLELFNDQDE